MYGCKSVTDEWTPGVFSSLWERYNDKVKSKKDWWLLCDGPVDTLWIESLNTVLDDNKILTLSSGDRLPMAEHVKIVFEVENLNNASPATVSRCGIVFVSPFALGFECLIDTYCDKRESKDNEIIRELLKKYLVKKQLFRIVDLECKPPKLPDFNNIGLITNILRLLNGVLMPYTKNN
jgi:dynein heavy chain